MTIDRITFNDDCVPEIYRLTFNGPATLSGATGKPIGVSFANFTMDIDGSGSATLLDLGGGLRSDCFGGLATFATDPRLGIPRDGVCPTAGAIAATLATGTTAQIVYHADGSVGIDANGDGIFEDSAPNCLDPRLLMCAG